MEEEYKEWIYEPKYLVYKDGKIFSKISNKFLKQNIVGNYYTVSLNENGRRFPRKVHIMVAKMFCENIYNKPEVDHIDRNPLNNKSENLRWVSSQENAKNRDMTNKKNVVKRVYQILVGNEDMAIMYNSISEASKVTGISKDMISLCCLGQCKYTTDNGKKSGTKYIWKYVDEIIKDNIPENSKEIKDYPNYLVTNIGEVFSLNTMRYMRLQKYSSGYIKISLHKNNKIKSFFIHRLVAEAFIENKPENYEKLYVNHINGIRDDNRVENLEYVTPSKNCIHRNMLKKNK